MVWVTAEEMHQRLLHLGVRRSLSLGMVLEALQRNNAGQKMVAKWEYQKELWYRSKAVDVADAVPLDQRNQRSGRQKRVGKIIFPPVNHFEGTQNQHFVALNEALEDLERERERKREEARQKANEDQGDVAWTAEDGGVHSTSCGDLSIDGAETFRCLLQKQ